MATASKGKTPDANLAEEVLRQGGASEEEVERMGKLDRADDNVERLFDESRQTTKSPMHRAIWEHPRLEAFTVQPLAAGAAQKGSVGSLSCQQQCLDIVKRHRQAGTLYDAQGKVSPEVIKELSQAGYWGLLIEQQYGGQETSIESFMKFLTLMSGTADPTVAGLASVHGCIGAVDPVRTFGTPEQKGYFLPKLASGESISAFALTEPNAGSDLTALRTTAVLDGDDYVVNGEKLFITNAVYGRTIGLVCLVESKPAVLVVELPPAKTENFEIIDYRLHALAHAENHGLKFTNFRVPAKNRLHTDVGDGLTIAYHGLNRGRVALCANAAGVMRLILRSITPSSWGQFRKTYGEAIEKRELVQARMARAAALIVGADALVAWCSRLLDRGYRGELECVIAKVYGSEAQKEVAIEVGMKTHGGRSFLEGHLIGDNLYDYLAPMIYEGEGQMLNMALFKTLAKEHGTKFMLPLGNALKATLKSAKKLKLLALFTNLFAFLWAGLSYSFWQLRKRLPRFKQSIPGMDKRLKKHVRFAQSMFHKLPLELSGAMVKHQLKLAERQRRISHLSQRAQDVVVMLITCLHAHKLRDEGSIAAADVLCRHLRQKLTGSQPTDADFAAESKLGSLIVAGQFQQLSGVPETPILRAYK